MDGKFLSLYGNVVVTLTPARNGHGQDVLVGSKRGVVCFEGAVPSRYDAQQTFNTLCEQARYQEGVREKLKRIGLHF